MVCSGGKWYLEFFRRRPLSFPRQRGTLGYEAVHLPDGRNWLLRPVVEGMTDYVHLVDGSLSLDDLANMNDALSVRDENEYRAGQVKQ